MVYPKLDQEKVNAILTDVNNGMKVILLQAKHGTSMHSMYKIPQIREKLFGRSKRKRQEQILLSVAFARNGLLQRDIAKQLGISIVTVRKHLRRAEADGLISQEERIALGKAANKRMLKKLWEKNKV